MIYGPSHIYPIFGPTDPKMGKKSRKFFFLFYVIITLATTSFLKENYLNKKKTLLS